MKAEKRILKTLAAFALLCGLSLSAHAQVGSGWSPGGETILSQQTSSGCTITPISGGYEFHSAATGRAENRWSGADLTTEWQWTGTCKIVSWPSGSSNTCIYQLWGSPSGDLIIDMTAGGSSNTNLMSLHDGDKVVGNVPVGTPFNYAAVYDTSTATELIFINGSHTGTTKLIDSISGGHYDKNGSYVSNSGVGNDTVDWTNTSNWKGGNPFGSGNTFTISASAGSGGSISPSGAVNVNQGNNQSFTITPNSGFSISSVTVDGANQGAITSYTFSNVQANHTISAAFQQKVTQFTITASAGSGGSISPSGNVLVNQGANQSFTITANSGFTVSSVTVDGTNQGAITSYTFSNVQANHTIAASFQSSGGGCETATGTWASYATNSVSGTFTATFDATPHASGITAFIGMTNGSSFSKSNSPWLVKFHSTGDLEALNGSSYAAVNTIDWVDGSTYHFRVVVNLPGGTYSVYVTPPGQSEQTLATNYAFQISESSLNNWGMQDTASSLEVCNFAD